MDVSSIRCFESRILYLKKRDKKPVPNGDAALLKQIKQVHKGRRRCYGSPRVYRKLKQSRVTCSRRRVARLMRENGIKATVVGLYYYNPKRRDHYQRVDNHLREALPPTGINQQWVADFTYLKTKQKKWVYLATVMDLFSRRIVGWSISEVRDASFTQSSLDMATRSRRPVEGAIFHTDQGIEYAANVFQNALKEAKFKPSMSGKGRCLDNANAESFFHTFKTESFYQRKFKDMDDIREEFLSYIRFYNEERLHSSLNYMPPNDYECAAA
jgi:putative transposase